MPTDAAPNPLEPRAYFGFSALIGFGVSGFRVSGSRVSGFRVSGFRVSEFQGVGLSGRFPGVTKRHLNMLGQVQSTSFLAAPTCACVGFVGGQGLAFGVRSSGFIFRRGSSSV